LQAVGTVIPKVRFQIARRFARKGTEEIKLVLIF